MTLKLYLSTFTQISYYQATSIRGKNIHGKTAEKLSRGHFEDH